MNLFAIGLVEAFPALHFLDETEMSAADILKLGQYFLKLVTKDNIVILNGIIHSPISCWCFIWEAECAMTVDFIVLAINQSLVQSKDLVICLRLWT